jgi:hypothetical protein
VNEKRQKKAERIISKINFKKNEKQSRMKKKKEKEGDPTAF